MKSLDNYRSLLSKVDELTASISTAHAGHITCHRGCDSCCRHLSLSLVEGVALAEALTSLPEDSARALREKAKAATANGPCPLLHNGECALYAHRPIICRTHGLPILIADGEGQRIDFCPLNFSNVPTLPGDAVVMLDRLNTILAAVNELFITECQTACTSGTDRISIAEALLLKI